MPVPTDTFWNMKRLNLWFAASSILLVLVTAWTILQDYGAWWRIPQKDSRIWDAALVHDKIDRLDDKQLEAQKAKIGDDLKSAEAQVAKHQTEFDDLTKKIHQMDSQRQTMEFEVNTLKANVGVDFSHLQDAITNQDQSAISELTKKLEGPSKDLTRRQEALEAKKMDIDQAKAQLKTLTKNLDDANKARNKLLSDIDGLNKRLDQLAPQSIIAKLSGQVRAMPLMGFLNPSERVQQVVLEDVLTDMNFQKRVPTLDRCMTCHVNIAKKDFTEENVLAYLEEQTGTAKGLKLPEKWSGVSTDPTATNAQPGAVALTEFWHAWAKSLAADSFKKSVAKLKSVTNTVGKSATIKIDGKTLTTFAYDPNLVAAGSHVLMGGDPASPLPQKSDAGVAATKPSTQPTINTSTQDSLLVTLLDAWLKYDGTALSTKSPDGKITIDLAANIPAAQLRPIRNASMRYADELRTALKQSLSPEQSKLLLSRYRYALVDLVNKARKAQGRETLDPSPVLLAHPRLDLYVDQDSKHSIDAVGCTSCHDGSGQETDFVVTAHTPRKIWVDQSTGEPVLENQLTQSVAEQKPFNLSSMRTSVCPNDAIVPASVNSLQIKQTAEQKDELKKLDKAGDEEKVGPIPYVDPVTGKPGKAVTQFQHWQEKYEPLAPRPFKLVYEEWDWPMRTPEYMQVNCARCHSEIYDIKDEAPTLYEGRYLFANMGCSNCHQMDSIPTEQNRKVGTDLRHITAKLSPAYINTWIWAPKAFRPSTKMPHFFMLENNSSTEEIRRTRQEARAITEYLIRTATPLPPAHTIPEGLKGSAEAGQKTFESIGCMGCHANLNDPIGPKRPDGGLITRGESWITTDLIKSGKLKSELTPKNNGKEPTAAELSTE
ncbi:MAG TPA: hypothetical protein VHS31_03610, partial [Tepidisphaeraceae bacterium]|nr:hypothetical protein [Tepidisphaeraceae bacterium]